MHTLYNKLYQLQLNLKNKTDKWHILSSADSKIPIHTIMFMTRRSE